MKDDKLLELLESIKRDNTKLDEAIKALKPDVWIPPKDTLVLCDKRYRRYSAGELNSNGLLICYHQGATSQTAKETLAWETWEPVPDAKPLIPWQPYTPVRPGFKLALVMRENLNIDIIDNSLFEWDNSKRTSKNKITHFCVWG